LFFYKIKKYVYKRLLQPQLCGSFIGQVVYNKLCFFVLFIAWLIFLSGPIFFYLLCIY